MVKAGILCISLLAAIAWPSTGIAQGPATRVTVRLDGVTLRVSLDSLMQWFGVSVVYLDADIEGKQVTVDCDECDLGMALDRILSGTSLTWVQTGTQVILRKQAAARAPLLATVSGSVTDSITGQSVGGAYVLLHEGTGTGGVLRWCPANEFGFYSLRRLAPGTYTLVVRTLGYHPARRTFTLADSAPLRIDVALHPEEIRMQEVTIEGHRSALSSTEGYARGLYIPAAPTDQTQYLLEGARIYNPSHFGSVLSTFNAEVMAEVDVRAGGLPPQYGGRIGGMLDLSMRNGSRHRLSGSAGTGSLGSQLALEGPLGSSTTFLLSWRRGYPDPLVPFLSEYGTPSPLATTEFIGRLSHRLSGSQQLALSGYASRDAYTARVEDAGLELNNNFGWENRAVSLRWNGIASPSLFFSASAFYSGYDFSLEHIVGAETAERFLSEFSVQDFSLRAHAEHYYDEHHMLRGGVELVQRRIGGDIQKFSTQIAPLMLRNTTTWELSVYLQDQWVLMPRVSAGLGARATTYTGAQGSYSAVDPRFSLLVALDDDTRLYGALTSIHQFVHGYRNSGVFLLYPPNFFYPSSEEVKPTSAVHAALGFQTVAGDQEYILSAESFYRVTYNVHGFFAPPPADPPASLTDATRYGSGVGYGVELSARKRLGDLRGALSYTLAWAKETYAEVNGGNPIPSPFDRRHEVQGTLLWVPAEQWTIGLFWVLTANEPRTFELLAPSDGISLGGVGTPALHGFVDVNGGRLPGFQRLEVDVTRTFRINSMLCSISLRFLNAYGLTDPFLVDLITAPDGSVTWRARLRDLTLFPLFPTLAVNVRF